MGTVEVVGMADVEEDEGMARTAYIISVVIALYGQTDRAGSAARNRSNRRA